MLKTTLFNRLSTLGLVSAIGIGMFTLVKLQEPQLNALEKKNLNKIDFQEEADQEKMNLEMLQQMPSFGYDNLIADWAFLRFIQYYGDDEARDKTGYELSPEYLKLVIKNDPRFVNAYLVFSPAISIHAGLPQETVKLLGEGLKYLSPKQESANYVWLYKALDQLLFLGDVEGAKKSYAMAALWAKEAGNLELAKANEETIEYLNKNPQSKKVRVGAWFMVFVNARHPQTRRLAVQKIKQLGGKITFTSNGRVTAIPPKE